MEGQISHSAYCKRNERVTPGGNENLTHIANNAIISVRKSYNKEDAI